MRHLFVDSYFIFLLHQRLLNKQTNKIFDITNLSHVASASFSPSLLLLLLHAF